MWIREAKRQMTFRAQFFLVHLLAKCLRKHIFESSSLFVIGHQNDLFVTLAVSERTFWNNYLVSPTAIHSIDVNVKMLSLKLVGLPFRSLETWIEFPLVHFSVFFCNRMHVVGLVDGRVLAVITSFDFPFGIALHSSYAEHSDWSQNHMKFICDTVHQH